MTKILHFLVIILFKDVNKAKLFVKIGRKATGLKSDRRVTHIKHSGIIWGSVIKRESAKWNRIKT